MRFLNLQPPYRVIISSFELFFNSKELRYARDKVDFKIIKNGLAHADRSTLIRFSCYKCYQITSMPRIWQRFLIFSVLSP